MSNEPRKGQRGHESGIFALAKFVLWALSCPKCICRTPLTLSQFLTQKHPQNFSLPMLLAVDFQGSYSLIPM